MGTILKILLPVVLVLGWTMVEPLAAEGNGNAAMGQLQARIERFAKNERLFNVVRISGAKRSGYGLIIGRQFDKLFVATARHILHKDFVNDAPGGSQLVKVRLYGLETYWRPIPGRVYEPLDDSGVTDLAIIQVVVPQQPQADGGPFLKADTWREDVVVADPVAGAAVELAATTHDIGYAGGHGRIAEVVDGRAVRFRDLHGEEGQSGAAIATDRGFVGLYLGSVNRQGISLLDIKRVVEEEFGSPIWMLQFVDARSVSRRICVEIRSRYSCDLTVAGPVGVVQMDADMCGASYTGSHTVYCNRTGIECEPRSFHLAEDTAGAIVIKCGLDPSGMWRSHGQGFLSLHRAGPGRWRATIDLPRQMGRIVGAVTGAPPLLNLENGMLRGRYPVYGSIVVEEDELRLDFVSEGEFINGVYVR